MFTTDNTIETVMHTQMEDVNFTDLEAEYTIETVVSLQTENSNLLEEIIVLHQQLTEEMITS